MNEFFYQLIYESWPWYIGGPLIGVFALAVLLFERKALGISSSFEQVCAVIMPRGNVRDTLLKDPWQTWFVLGMVIGGIILHTAGLTTEKIALAPETEALLIAEGLTNLNGYAPVELYTFAWPQFLILLLGGFVIGFGVRYAGGCTAGHSIMGIAQLAPASMLATAGFFAGGLISSYFIVPFILSL